MRPGDQGAVPELRSSFPGNKWTEFGADTNGARRRGKHIPNYFCDFGGEREKRLVRTGTQMAGA